MISGAPTSTTAFIGWAPQGPLDRPVVCRGPQDYVREFGGLDSGSLLGYAVAQYFVNGGREATVVRLGRASVDAGVIEPETDDFSAALVGRGSVPGAFRLLDRVDQFSLLNVPGHSWPADLEILQAYCRARRALLIQDTSRHATFVSLQDGMPLELVGTDAVNAVCYHPWLLVADPHQGGRPRVCPPGGAVAGLYARTDATHGVWRSPSGIEAALAGVVGLNESLSDEQNRVLGTAGINGIRELPGRGFIVWGARTLRSGARENEDWKYVAVRRTALFIEESIRRGLAWVAFEPNDHRLWTKVWSEVGLFLLEVFRSGAFPGHSPQAAFSVACDASTTSPDDIERGVVGIQIGLALLRSSEFAYVRIEQPARPRAADL